eukprot:TRINITY_DN146_c1_g1_i1.p1 TRINITY_DN146_c1_g1~~TRINITY_DN146_c1_g1_i1.p1  ORF type:complete len:447 (+),score=104.68 TRINITY_DN146_c1_g1_i1:460-1800(+)
MSVIFETNRGNFTLDLFVDEYPVAATNFLKLCKLQYYRGCSFFRVIPDVFAQCGDRTNRGDGGESIYGVIKGKQDRFLRCVFPGGKRDSSLHRKGLISMVSVSTTKEVSMIGSQFVIALSDSPRDRAYLEDGYVPVAQIVEGLELLDQVSALPIDPISKKTLEFVAITHVEVLDDPFDDPEGMPKEEMPPLKSAADALVDFDPQDQEENEKREAKSRAIVLEMVGDLPDADVRPPDNIIFVCKLNPETDEEGLDMLFSRFGKILSCEVIRDWKTGQSLNYAFIEYEDKKSCELAYFKMHNVLVDDRRIHVDFSQSVSQLWNKNLRMRRKRQRMREQPARKPLQSHRPSDHHEVIEVVRHRERKVSDDRRSRWDEMPVTNEVEARPGPSSLESRHDGPSPHRRSSHGERSQEEHRHRHHHHHHPRDDDRHRGRHRDRDLHGQRERRP